MDTKRSGNWIQTYSGIKFFPFDPRSEEITIVDIAHALSMQCRFTGHVKEFYSVAQHSVMVSYYCKKENALWGLLHDASEAYLSDVSRPVKYDWAMDGYRNVEKTLMLKICEKFGLPPDMPEDVRIADNDMCASEGKQLMLRPPVDNWIYNVGNPIEEKLFPESPYESYLSFTSRFNYLTYTHGALNARD
jgi:hypothetical protein